MNVHIGQISVTPQIMPLHVMQMGTAIDYVTVGAPIMTIDFRIHCTEDELPPGSDYRDMFNRLALTIEDALLGKDTPEQLQQKFAEVLGPRRIKA